MKKRNPKNQIGDHTHLSNLRIGQKGKVLSLLVEDRSLRRKLLDMGITEGVQIKIKKIAPLGDPVDIALRGYELCIRRTDLSMIMVEVIS